MEGQQGKEMRRRHSIGSARFSEIRGLYNRVMAGQRPVDVDGAEAIRNDNAGDRRGTSARKVSSRKGGGQ